MAAGKKSGSSWGMNSYVKGGDPAQPDMVLIPVGESRAEYTPATHADAIRHTIAADSARHGQWFHLSMYRPMPRRHAIATAIAWRNAAPGKFGGDRHFEARIMPVDNDGHGRDDLAITRATLYTVAIRYPMGDAERDYEAASDRDANQDDRG
jgi:hypothetical protein